MVDNIFGVLFRLSLGAGGDLLIITVTFLGGIKHWEIHLGPKLEDKSLQIMRMKKDHSLFIFLLHLTLTFNS